MYNWTWNKNPKSPFNAKPLNLPRAEIEPKAKTVYSFDGKKENYFTFMEHLRHSLEEKSMAYLMSPTEIASIMTPVQPPVYIPLIPQGTEQENYAINLQNQTISRDYEHERRLQSKKYESLKTDVYRAIAAIQELCGPVPKAEIYSVKLTEAYRQETPPGQLSIILTHMREKYGPDGDRTAHDWEKKLEALNPNGVYGMAGMISQYTKYVSFMEQILRLDVHGNPILVGTRSEKTYCPTDDRLRMYLVGALRKANIDAYRNYAAEMDSSSHPPSPEEIVEKIRRLIDKGYDTTPERKLAPWAARRSNPGASKFSHYIRAASATFSELFPNDENNSVAFATGAEERPPVQCANCRADDHLVRDCQAKICGSCGKWFDTVLQRRQHYYAEHKPNRENPRKSPSPAPSRAFNAQQAKRPRLAKELGELKQYTVRTPTSRNARYSLRSYGGKSHSAALEDDGDNHLNVPEEGPHQESAQSGLDDVVYADSIPRFDGDDETTQDF